MDIIVEKILESIQSAKDDGFQVKTENFLYQKVLCPLSAFVLKYYYDGNFEKMRRHKLESRGDENYFFFSRRVSSLLGVNRDWYLGFQQSVKAYGISVGWCSEYNQGFQLGELIQ